MLYQLRHAENPQKSQTQKIMGKPRPKKTVLCVWWDCKGVIYYEFLKPGENVDT